MRHAQIVGTRDALGADMSKHTTLPTIDLDHLHTVTGGLGQLKPPTTPTPIGPSPDDPKGKPPVKPNPFPSPFPFPLPDPFDPKGKPPGFM